MPLAPGDLAPDFTLPSDGGKSVTLSSLRGRKVILYFYPKDNTSGCTKEACDFRDALPNFQTTNAVVLGISRDSVASHDKFKATYKLSFPLLADVDGKVCESYGVWVQKSMYGRVYYGIERTTVLIDPQGKITQIWRKVKVPGHAEAVLEAVKKI